MATEIPQAIKEAMLAAQPPIKTIGQLVTRMQHPSAGVYRIFSGKNQHTTLKTYKRISEICGWTLDQFFAISHGNSPESISQFLRGRLEHLGISIYAFCAYLSGDTKGSGGWFEYLNGNHKYERLTLYYSLKTALGITADTMYEALIISEDLQNLPDSEKISATDRQQVLTYSRFFKAS